MKFLSAALSKRVNIKLLILDCDGIIFDSNNLKTEGYRQSLRALKVSEEGVNDFVKLHLSDVSVSRFVKFQRFFSDIYKVPQDEVETYTNRALDGFSNECLKLYGDLAPVEQAIQLAQKAEKVYVVSGGAQTELNHVFKEHGIDGHFDEILGSPITKDVHLERIFTELHTNIAPEETLFIGDGFTDFKTARKMNTHFCFLKQMTDWKNYEQDMGSDIGNQTICDHWDDVLGRIDC
jgi:phosphoglycolate phosphatase-like HAD superfamily hydrolase